MTKNQFGEKNHTWVNIDEKLVLKMYLDDFHNIKYISKYFGVSRCVIRKRLKKNNIKIRTFSEQYKLDKENGRQYNYGISEGENNGSYVHGNDVGKKEIRRRYLKKVKKNKKWVCERCGLLKSSCGHELVVHHIDMNHGNESIDNLMVLCNACHTKEHFKNRRNLFEYDIDEIELTNEYVDMVDLEVEDNNNFILSNGFLTHNSGKSFFIRTISDRLSNIGEVVVHLNDTKNEFFSSAEPCQEKFHHLLLKGEKPQGFKMVTLRPTFFKTIDQKLADKNYWYSVDSRQLTQADFMTLMNSNECSASQKTSLELLYQDIKKALEDDDSLELDYDLIESLIEENQDIDGRQKKGLIFKFKPLKTSHFFEKEHVKNIVTAIQNGFIPTINNENFDSFGQGSFLFPEVTLNIVLREVIKARRAKKIKRTWVMFDESSRFIGKSTDTSIRTSILQSMDLDTRYGINYITAWQSMTDIPERILQQSRYIFVPQTADVGTIKDVLINTGMVKNIQRSVNKAIELKKRLKANKFSWLIIDRVESRMDLVIPLAPLSHHLESTR